MGRSKNKGPRVANHPNFNSNNNGMMMMKQSSPHPQPMNMNQLQINAPFHPTKHLPNLMNYNPATPLKPTSIDSPQDHRNDPFFPNSLAKPQPTHTHYNQYHQSNTHHHLQNQTPQEIRETIDILWKNLSPGEILSEHLQSFLLSQPTKLSLLKFVEFWTRPQNVAYAEKNPAGNICGCSWYLAFNYMVLGMVDEARALLCNGCFLQQCYNTPIEEIQTLIQNDPQGDYFSRLPFFRDGILSISSEERMMTFLRSKVSVHDFLHQKTKRQVNDYVRQISSDWNNESGSWNGGGGGGWNGARTNDGKRRGKDEYNSYNSRRRKEMQQRHILRRRASTGAMGPNGEMGNGVNGSSGSVEDCDDGFIELTFVDATTKDEIKLRYGPTMSLKLLFRNYAEENDLPWKQLRFSYKGKNLFLSSLGQKTVEDVGIGHADCIFVHNTGRVKKGGEGGVGGVGGDGAGGASGDGGDGAAGGTSAEETKGSHSSTEDESNTSSSDKETTLSTSALRKQLRRASFTRRNSWTPCDFLENAQKELDLRKAHSTNLSKLFDEAQPKFKQIRDQLNLLNIECDKPKKKRSGSGGKKKNSGGHGGVPIQRPVDNPNTEGEGGKAGVPFYVVNVGEVEHLYRTRTMPNTSNNSGNSGNSKPLSVDLHGLTKSEALETLDGKLPEWIDMAMRSNYPFVIQVCIICGGGAQVLSEAVDGWIKRNENVACAPKKKFSRRRSI